LNTLDASFESSIAFSVQPTSGTAFYTDFTFTVTKPQNTDLFCEVSYQTEHGSIALNDTELYNTQT